MKKLLYFFFITSYTLLHPSSDDQTKLFLGAVQFPEPLTYDLCLYYKGKKIPVEWDKNDKTAQFSFLESKQAQDLFILISDNISYKTNENNTIQHLQASTNHYKCYKLQATRSYDDNNELSDFSWNVQEYVLHQAVIPDNTLIFFFNPSYIEGLLIHSWSKNNTMRLLPTITISPSITSKELGRAITITRLAAMDIDILHTKTAHQQSQ